MAAAATDWVTSGAACRALGIDRRTLVKWADQGRIRTLRPGGTGNRRFDLSSILPEKAGGAQTDLGEEPAAPVDAIYARVSTRKQKPYLDNQVEDLKSKYPDHRVFTDVCSGINFRRKGLKALLELAFAGRLRVVRVAHRDRLCRFAYDLLEWLFQKHGAKIVVEAADADTPERELADDVLSVITVFGARLYGSRSKRGKRKRSEEEGQDGAGPGQLPDQASAGGGSAVSDSLGEVVPDVGPDAGASTLLRGGALELQRGGGSGKRRGRPPKLRAAVDQGDGRGSAGPQGGALQDSEARDQAGGGGVRNE
jgi:excisionase family DNA binding protein